MIYKIELTEKELQTIADLLQQTPMPYIVSAPILSKLEKQARDQEAKTKKNKDEQPTTDIPNK